MTIDGFPIVFDLMRQLMLIVLLSFANAGLAMFIRALPWPQEWLSRKPLACPVCMTGWSAFATLAAAREEFLLNWSFTQVAIAWCVCIAIGAPIFRDLFPPPLAFPEES